MGAKQRQGGEKKKPGKNIKEKRAAKTQKKAAKEGVAKPLGR